MRHQRVIVLVSLFCIAGCATRVSTPTIADISTALSSFTCLTGCGANPQAQATKPAPPPTVVAVTNWKEALTGYLGGRRIGPESAETPDFFTGMVKSRTLVAVLVVAAAAGWFLRGRFAAPDAPLKAQASTHRVTRGRIEQTVRARGIVKPAPNALIKVGFTFPKDVTRRIQYLPVVEGDYVDPGAELARLDHEDLDAALEQRQADMEAIQRRLNALKELESIEVRMTEAELAERAAELEQARRNLERSEELRDRQVVSTQQWESALTEHALTKARTQLSGVKLEDVRARFRTDISILEAQMDQARAAIRETQVQVRWSTLRSPLNKRAQVYAVHQRPGEAAGGQAGMPVVTLLDTNQLEAHLFIDEADFGRIQLGQMVTLRAESHPDKILSARIVRVLPQSILQENVVYYMAVAEVEQEQRSLLRVDMTVLGQVEAAAQESALWLPISAVRSGPGGWYVLRSRPDGPVETPVGIGWKDQGRVEIREGLAEGDEVLLGP